MKRLLVLLVVPALVAACGGSSAALSTLAKSSAPPGPVTKYKNTLSGLNASTQIDLIQNVIDFAPGAASVVHIHTSPNLATLIQGQITVKTPAGDRKAAVGEMLVEPINVPLQAVNIGTGEATVVVAFVVPHGGKPTSAVAGQAAPALLNKTMFSFILSAPIVSGSYSLVQQILDFAPGSQTPQHRHGGPGLVTVLQGQVTFSRDGLVRTFNAGESFVEMPGETLQAFNRGSADLVLAATFLLPDGVQLTTNV
jgi:quercetin dioxygenase-like cupin family protein